MEGIFFWLLSKEKGERRRRIFSFYCNRNLLSLAGKKIIKLEVCSGERDSSTSTKLSKRSRSCGLTFKLDELRQELASLDGGIFPHSVLSTQQINMLSAEKPRSMEQVQSLIS